MKNLLGFTFPNRNTPKTHPILGANHRRGVFRGVCNTPLHGYTQNPLCFRRKSLSQDISGAYAIRPYTGTCKICPGSTFPYPDTPKTHLFSPFPIGIHRKPTWFYTQTVSEVFLGAYAFAPLHGYVQNLAGFTFPHPDTPKTHPILPSPIRIRPKPARF